MITTAAAGALGGASSTLGYVLDKQENEFLEHRPFLMRMMMCSSLGLGLTLSGSFESLELCRDWLEAWKRLYSFPVRARLFLLQPGADPPPPVYILFLSWTLGVEGSGEELTNEIPGLPPDPTSCQT